MLINSHHLLWWSNSWPWTVPPITCPPPLADSLRITLSEKLVSSCVASCVTLQMLTGCGKKISFFIFSCDTKCWDIYVSDRTVSNCTVPQCLMVLQNIIVPFYLNVEKYYNRKMLFWQFYLKYYIQWWNNNLKQTLRSVKIVSKWKPRWTIRLRPKLTFSIIPPGLHIMPTFCFNFGLLAVELSFYILYIPMGLQAVLPLFIASLQQLRVQTQISNTGRNGGAVKTGVRTWTWNLNVQWWNPDSGIIGHIRLS